MSTKDLVSIIVPTFREAKNIPVLTERIHEAMKAARIAYEVIVVDDNSQDGIEEAVNQLKKKKFPISIKVRLTERGLSSAVIEGFRLAKGTVFAVMDADLSHPPEKIPELVAPIMGGSAEFVVGGRFVPGGSAEHFNWFRRLNAWVSKTLARPFTTVRDPMAGFFAFPISILPDLTLLNPLGFKIGLEVIVKGNPRTTMEIPIQFKERLYGESKLSIKEQVNYLRHIIRLFEYKYESLAEMIKFGFVGGTGTVVNMAFVFLSYDILSISYRIAVAIGFLVSATSNFILNRTFTFPKSRQLHSAVQYALFIVVGGAGFAVNWFIAVYLYENNPFFHEHYLLATFLGILGGMTINFTGSKLLVFRKGTTSA